MRISAAVPLFVDSGPQGPHFVVCSFLSAFLERKCVAGKWAKSRDNVRLTSQRKTRLDSAALLEAPEGDSMLVERLSRPD